MSKKELSDVKERIREITRQVIRELRERENLTQTQLAEKVGINRSLISQYESGDREPSLLSLVKLANYAHVSVDYLLGREKSAKYELTKAEEKLVQVWRRMPPRHELTVHKKETPKPNNKNDDDDVDDSQIRVKLDVKL